MLGTVIQHLDPQNSCSVATKPCRHLKSLGAYVSTDDVPCFSVGGLVHSHLNPDAPNSLAPIARLSPSTTHKGGTPSLVWDLMPLRPSILQVLFRLSDVRRYILDLIWA